jgi:hypothetical protein
VLRTPSFSRASDRSRRAAGINGAFAMPGATVDPAGTSGSLARTKGMVRRKAIPQPAVS